MRLDNGRQGPRRHIIPPGRTAAPNKPRAALFEKTLDRRYNTDRAFPAAGSGEVAMEKRREMRVKKRVLSSLEDKPAIIVDMSESGIQIAMNRPPRNQNVDIKLQIDGQVITLKGDIRWIERVPTSHSANNIGIAIREAPPEYYRFLSLGR
jgi:hypothetical protein